MDIYIPAADLKAALLALPEMAEWPEVADIFSPDSGKIRCDWQLPVFACQAVGGNPALMAPAVAALACLQSSIILTDDMLDQDPRGAHQRLGSGRAANLALAFQAAALALVGAMDVDTARRSSATAAIAHAALTTAWGQELDAQNLSGEANYWRVVRTKSTPFYGLGLELGGLFGGAAPEVSRGLYEVGVALGRLVQIYDDLDDALATPANPDWREGRNNLLLLYALGAEHDRRGRLIDLRRQVAEPAALVEAQQILVSCGAVSYAVFLIVQEYEAALALLRRLPLADPTLLLNLFWQQVAPLGRWLHGLGMTVPDVLQGPQP